MRIVVVEDGQRTELDLTSPSLRIGRAVDNDLRLAGHLVSRHHCLIERKEDEWWVTDLGSANGTLLNEVRVSRSRVQPGDRLRVGKAHIEFAAEGVEALLARRRGQELGTATLTDSGSRERENLNAFALITRELVRETEPGKLLRLIVDSALSLVRGERAFLLLSEEALGDEALALQPGSALELNGLKVRVARNYDREDIPVPSTRLSLGVAKAVLEQKQGLLALDAASDPRFQGMASVEELRLRSVLCVPLVLASDSQAPASGVLYVDNRLQAGAFSHEDLASLELLADQAAIALRNVRRTRELRERFETLGQQARKIEQLSEQLGRKGREPAGAGPAAGAAESGTDAGRERGRYDYSSIVGQSGAMRRVFAQIDRIIESDLPVVIHGESGTGKELVARAIHFNGPRKAKPFVSENCAALPDTLLESELFGHARGAFTGAHRAKKGLIEQAHGGTLFLDEIGDMSAEMQKKLLRVLQEGELRAVGSEERVKVDVRVIAASHRNLQELVKEGRFREDLYYRLNVLAVSLPALRARREDIPRLAEALLARAAREANRPVPVLSREVLAALVDYDWPGNVRELENEMRRIVVLTEEVVRLEHLSGEILGKRSSLAAAQAAAVAEGTTGIRDAVAELERLSVLQAIDAAGGNKTKAAAALGISRFALQRKLDKYGLGSRAAEGETESGPS